MPETVRVLLVEDEPMIASSVEKGLREAGINVRWVYNGYHLAQAESFDALVLDIMLPDRDTWPAGPNRSTDETGGSDAWTRAMRRSSSRSISGRSTPTSTGCSSTGSGHF